MQKIILNGGWARYYLAVVTFSCLEAITDLNYILLSYSNASTDFVDTVHSHYLFLLHVYIYEQICVAVNSS